MALQLCFPRIILPHKWPLSPLLQHIYVCVCLCVCARWCVQQKKTHGKMGEREGKKGSVSELKGLLSVDAAEDFEGGCLISFEIASARRAHCDAALFQCCVFSVPSGLCPLPCVGNFFFFFLTFFFNKKKLPPDLFGWRGVRRRTLQREERRECVCGGGAGCD